MENPFRKLFAFKRNAWQSKPAELSTPDAGMQTVAYESTAASSKSPIFISQPLRRSMTEQISRNALEGLAIRALSYESAVPGKPPIVGGRPHRGNGPVKLQTSRRLSSGELLVTSQDPRRTLEDILEGDYIVGGAKKRASRSPQVRSPTPSLSSPASSVNLHSSQHHLPHFSIGSSGSTHIRSISAVHDREHCSLVSHHRPIYAIHPHLSLPNLSEPHQNLPPQRRTVQGLAIENIHPIVEFTTPKSPSAPLLISTEILKRAERTHLASLRTVEERPDVELTEDQAGKAKLESLSDSSGLSTPLAVQVESANSEHDNHHHSFQSQPPSFSEETSDCSSHQRSSLLGSEASSAHTACTSIPDESSDTREQVHRLVDNVRLNYLKAIEQRTRQDLATKADGDRTAVELTRSSRRKKEKPSEKNHSGRQSWRSSDITANKILNTWRWRSDTEECSDLQPEESMDCSRLEVQDASVPSLQRADSMTLGSMLTSSVSTRSQTRRRKVQRADDPA